MYCPACGKVNTTDQKFCRGCGLSLEKIVQALDDVSPVMDPALQEKTKRIDRLLIGAAALGISPFVLLILYAITYKLIYIKGKVGEGLAFLAFFLGLIIFALLAIYRNSLQKAANQKRAETAELNAGVGTARLLNESHFEPVPSVTDRTTELLHVERERGRNDTPRNLEL